MKCPDCGYGHMAEEETGYYCPVCGCLEPKPLDFNDCDYDEALQDAFDMEYGDYE